MIIGIETKILLINKDTMTANINTNLEVLRENAKWLEDLAREARKSNKGG